MASAGVALATAQAHGGGADASAWRARGGPTAMHPRVLWQYRELVRNLAVRDLRAGYRGMDLGVLWSIINPLALIVTYFLMFRYVFGLQPVPNFALFLSVGILHWNFFSTFINGSSQVVVVNANLLEKVAFPRILIPVSHLVKEIVQHGFTMLAFSVAFFPLGGTLWWGLFAYPAVVLLMAGFAMGIGLAVSAMTVAFRDLREVTSIVMRMGLFVSPVLYRFERLSAEWQALLALNPFAPFLNAARDFLYYNRLPDAATWALMMAWTAVVLPAGFLVFRRMQARFTEWS